MNKKNRVMLISLILSVMFTGCVFKSDKPDEWKLEKNSKIKHELSDTYAYYGENSENYTSGKNNKVKELKFYLELTLNENTLTITYKKTDGTIRSKKTTEIKQIDTNVYEFSEFDGGYGTTNVVAGGYGKEKSILYVTKEYLYINSSSFMVGMMILPIPIPLAGGGESWDRYKRVTEKSLYKYN